MRFRSAKVRRSAYEGTRQADRILRAARAVFVREGAAGFSARRVAKEAQLSLGSVQHVFPTSDALLVAMLEYVITAYDDGYADMVAKLPLNAAARWQAVTDYLVDDIFRPDTRRFFWGFWALGAHNRLAGTLVREAYDHHRRSLAGFVAALRPELDERECLGIAVQVAALIEGAMLYTAHAAKSPEREALRETLRQGIRALVGAPRTSTAASSSPASTDLLTQRRLLAK